MNRLLSSRTSIRRQLLVQLLAGSAILALALFLIVQNLARQLSAESQDNILAASVTSILETANIKDGELELDLPYSAFSMLASLHDDAVFYAVEADGVFQSGYDDLPNAEKRGADGMGFATVIYKEQDVRIVTADRSLASGETLLRITATIGQTRSGQRITLTRISRWAAALGVGFFVTAALLAVISARSAIAPLERLADSVARRGPQDLRPVVSEVPSEMVPLVAALNRFIERLQNSLARSEDFIAEAAHRVRTPLATVRMQAEVTLQRVEKEENRKSVREMMRAVDESSRAAGQLLDHAMVTFRTDHLEEVDIDLREMVLDLVDRLRPTADLREITLNTNAARAVPIKGDPILIQNALRNILDNAIKYSPSDSNIDVDVEETGEHAQVVVSDSGLGFAEADLGSLTQRFARGSNVEGVIGSGLGLTIADEVLRAHGGQLELRNKQKGPGACVTLRFSLS